MLNEDYNDPVTTSCVTPVSGRESRCSIKSTNTSSSSGKIRSEIPQFPQIKTRIGRKILNESFVRCLVQCLSEFKVSHADLAGIIVRTANIMFGQKWTLSGANQTDASEGCTGESSSNDEEDVLLIR